MGVPMSSGTLATTIFARPCGLNSAAELSDGAIHRIAMKTATRPSNMATPRIMSDCPRATPPSSAIEADTQSQATARDDLLQAPDEVAGRARLFRADLPDDLDRMSAVKGESVSVCVG